MVDVVMMWFKLYLIVLYIVITKNIDALYVDDKCTPNNEETDGVCVKVTKCEPAIRAIRQRKTHPYQRCSFEGDNEIVCCPLTTTTTKFGSDTNGKLTQGNNNERISEKECQKISESILSPLDLHIIGGEEALTGEFPHMVAVGYDGENGYQFDCGGALVSSTYVLTAAHCVNNLEKKLPKLIRAGTLELGTGEWNDETDYRVVANISHPNYSRSSQYNDIALLRLERPIEVSSTLNAACLYTNPGNPDGDLIVTGWGKTSTTKNIKSNLLLKTKVQAVTREECTPHYRNWRKLQRGVIDDQLCAGDPQGGHDACQGDSGGPLQVMVGKEPMYRLVGVTSFGRGCGSTVPGIYTRVANYLDWIEGIVWSN